MAHSILVCYATRSGSTAEVAEAVGKTLRAAHVDAVVMPAKEVRSLDAHRGVILGAPLYMFRLHRDARAFLTRHREALAQKPVAVFALGPFHDEEKEWAEVSAQLEKELASFPWFSPVVRTVFGGAFDPARLGFPYTLIPALRRMPASDARDWKAIDAWATEMGRLLDAPPRGARNGGQL